jgi:hypothetical protein
MHRNIIIHTATFDLEAVLPIPCSLVSQAYYKRNSQVTILLSIPLVMEKGLVSFGMRLTANKDLVG